MIPRSFGRGFFCPIVEQFMENYMRYGPLLLMVFALNACTTVSVDDYADSEPLFVPESFFSGSLTAYGVVKNYKGFASRSFAADITACWQDGIGSAPPTNCRRRGTRRREASSSSSSSSSSRASRPRGKTCIDQIFPQKLVEPRARTWRCSKSLPSCLR